MALQSQKRKRPHVERQPAPRKQKRLKEDEDISGLEKRVQELDSKDPDNVTFAKLPLSQPTTTGLAASHFKTLTEIQKQAIPLALKGSDILGAAKTGSGKTLSFLIPVLENLYRKRWTEFDGLGALILSPTRELAIQIFEVLRKIGRYHTFSAGLVIGGKSLQEERERLGRMNILVCTPGRMLQHMDQTAAFEIDNLQMLVLDEADRIMDMGFQGTVDAIVEHLPQGRQTMLFSATQTKKVSDLARLSLRDPEYVSVHEAATSATPSTLQQNYVVTPLPEKLDTLWGFIRSNLKSKILVFMSSGKQVRFVYESFRRLQPGIPLLHLHGRQRQTARLDITSKFSATKNSCLLATDIVARGLDFPAVDWVIQLDCPEDADTYIHRVGRTARYERDGRAVLFLEPSEEEGMLNRLSHKKVSVEKIHVKQKKQQSIRSQLQNMCFKDPELKYLGQKAFVSYVKSIHLQKDKETFKIDALPLEEYSTSLGLPGAPRIKFTKGENAKTLKNAPRGIAQSSDDESGEEGEKRTEKKATRTKYDRMFERRNQDVLADHYSRLINDTASGREGQENDADEDMDFLKVKRRLSDASEHSLSASEADTVDEPSAVVRTVPLPGQAEPLLIDSKRREKLLKSKKAMLKLKGKGSKLVFDDEGNAHEVYELEDEKGFKKRGAADVQREEFLRKEEEKVRAQDVLDKSTAKEKRREKKEKRKRVLREEQNSGRQAVLGDDEDEIGEDLDKQGDLYEDRAEQEHAENEDVSRRKIPKRPKKWFEDDSDAERDNTRRVGDVDEPETLEDLEALATGML
ncbi:ATP-dependent RNA helicase dbp4 [Agyrium rufum]|nr:ATP-dependent RNA helicase dbp4 [Agyrium rufum]